MTDLEAAAREFDAVRPKLVGIAYAVLGSYSDAEDVVADCWVQLSQRDDVRDVEGWAVVTTSRRAIDLLRSARVRRERYVGPWLPEPLVGTDLDPADRVTLDDEVSYGLLVVLESLTPAQRTAFVLHDVFQVPFAEVATIVGRTPEAVRQLASNARRRVRARSGDVVVDKAEHRRVVDAFVTAAMSGDIDALVAVLDPSVVLVSDGGGVVRSALRPIVGADKVARFLHGLVAKGGPQERIETVTVNGATGVAHYDADGLASVVAVTLADGLVARVDIIRSPAKLRRS